MKHSAFDTTILQTATRKAGRLDSLCRTILVRRLEKLQRGALTFQDGPQKDHFGTYRDDFPVNVTVRIFQPRFYTRIVMGGVIGAAESYMDGDWATDDLAGLCRILAHNGATLSAMDKRMSALKAPLLQAYHALNQNSRSGSRKNIAAHYDLGNDFFKTFLDETMAYSSGYFERDSDSLDQASINKFDRLCQKLRLHPGDHLLEIGSGWGGFACHAARKYGCRVTTVTISREQLELTRQRIQHEGLQHLVTARFCDYRDIDGTFSKIASIEMIEAVGHQYYPTFFKQCMHLLREDGLLGLQAITIRDQHYHIARRNVDFIKRYIFPGGCLPSLTTLCHVATRHSDFSLTQVDDMTPHYARTLAIWRERFLDNEHHIAQLGYSESFRRMWNFYLCYCQAGFEERLTSVSQLVYARPGFRINL
jgi:cyclopropane-fatty-acyl-phospholipid synthase